MDAKYEGHCFTPRNGKAVEVNSLWYNSLKIMEELCKKFGDKKEAKIYEKMAETCKESFEEKFFNPKKKCLYDVIGDDKVRPNQLFSIALTYPVLEPNSENAKNMMSVVEKKLLTQVWIKNISKR